MNPFILTAMILALAGGVGLQVAFALMDDRCANSLICSLATLPF